MKKGCLIGGGIFAVLAIIFIGVLVWGIGINNQMIGLNNDVNLKWSNVESSYQRRSDLIPNLVSTVEQATSYERQTLTDVVQARARASSVQVDPTNLTPEKLAEFQQAQAGVGSALSRLLVTIERYPDLKANQNILALQNQLEGTENRIKIDRDNFNQSVTNYNNFIQRIPNNFVASFRNFTVKGTFKSDAGAENAPNVGDLFNNANSSN